MKFFRAAQMYGDGKNGYRLQIWGTMVDREDGRTPEDTGIIEICTKESHAHPFITAVSYKDREFPTLQEAIDQWKEDTKCP